ncbi:poly-beta-1,6-N-acetyl-D-glucosamine N-deacetylase PgaB [Neisseria chenwenguii]|uniref:Poly-beta-1,6-N-acetyl-D-glucosamine N-deacetylase PgaB n=1 Tax=Neisseria chenwenguii TaxID=1853278 RepID=A0A220S311_9NEIS|nr:poly-beta-1,6-N-acetyl-D-glucosamine N-deacetylase PgaB [Neisseria chenwenguii]ASK27817.1 poly-beta-1,6-N-acetyl-D-glucosamine N-deacetylase PgaB [Neisseria chenwenguii]ROV56559.1 poly-beta-1,6-N-acetyl-D-glucosamine N-deacetylase PgaB [Neisseria chenwenguii]
MNKRLLPLLCALAFPAAWAAGTAEPQIGSICYHDVIDLTKPADSSVSTTVRTKYYPQTLSTDRLIAHFNWLRDNGYTPVSWKQVKDARAGRSKLPAKPVLLNFDDGYASFYTTIYPLLKAYNYPAVYALVTSWLEVPEGGQVKYGNMTLPRSAFITWEQAREMQKSGLIEFASHTHDLHHGIVGNPGGSQFAAMFPGNYKNGRYETPEQYRTRIRNDLKTSRDIMTKRLGVAPTILVWPYGQFNRTALEIAREVGLSDDMTLWDHNTSKLNQRHIGRFLADQETGLGLLKSYFENKLFELPHHRAVYVRLDDLYDPDPVKQNKKYDLLVNRMYNLGANVVYLQAFADDNRDGAADGAYFPNRHLKMKADLFSQVSWQLNTRSGVEVRAWMPMLAYDLGSGYEYLTDSRTGQPTARAVKRLSPYNAKNRRTVAEIYEDLAFNARFKGLAFGDDGFITEFEAANQGNDAAKTDALIKYSDELKNAALKYSYNGSNEMKTVRGISADALMPSEKPTALAQNPAKVSAHYTHTAVTAAPLAEGSGYATPKPWLGSLLQAAKQSGIPSDKFVISLPNSNLAGQQLYRAEELSERIMQIRKAGFKNIAFRDDFVSDQPARKTVKPVFGVK